MQGAFLLAEIYMICLQMSRGLKIKTKQTNFKSYKECSSGFQLLQLHEKWSKLGDKYLL